jgi:predicted permease
MPAKAKTFLIWLVVIFLIYAIVQSPDRAAEIVKALVDVIVNAFTAIGQFFGNLVG